MSLSPQDHEQSWETLAINAQKGDKRAYHDLLKEISPFIRQRLAGKLANNDWVEEIVQDVLISVHKSLSSYNEDRPFKPWLNAIIQFRKTDFLRKHYRQKNLIEDSLDHTETFENNVTNPAYSGELKDIEAAIDSLPEKQKGLFKMLKMEGYSIKETAGVMKMSESAVKVAIHRITKNLQKKLKHYET